jgi:hypothetical protein
MPAAPQFFHFLSGFGKISFCGSPTRTPIDPNTVFPRDLASLFSCRR